MYHESFSNEWGMETLMVISAPIQKFRSKEAFIKLWHEKWTPPKEKEPTLLVVKVQGKEEAIPKEEVIYKVTGFNIWATESDKKRIRWAVKVDNKTEELPQKGTILKLKIKKEWADKEIIVMPYLQQPTEKVSVKTKIEKCFYVKVDIPAEYIRQEILTNHKMNIIQTLKYYNDESLNILKNKEQSILLKMEAYYIWKEMVGAGKLWDHKRYIISIQNKKDWSCDKKEKPIKFNYDIWSNIHYGFIGKLVGFTEFELLNGAGYAQIGDNNKSLLSLDTWEEYFKNRFVDFGDSDILGGFDDPKDQQAIKVGFRLYNKFKDNIFSLQVKDILDELYSTINRNKPLNIEQCEH